MKSTMTLPLIVLLGLVFVSPLSAQIATGEPRPGDPNSAKLEDDRYLVEVSRSNGAITRVFDKQGGIELIREPRLADNFRFTLPIPGKEPWQGIEANYVWGNRQKLSSVEVDAKKITLHWSKPLVNYLGEKCDVSAAMGIELAQDGVLLTLKIDNSTRYPIGEVFFPIIGGIQGIGKTGEQLKATQFVRPTAADAVATADIFRVFANMWWLGDHGPEQFHACPKDLSWIEFSTPQLNRSIYVGAHDAANRSLVFRLELLPGSSGTLREDGNWPRPSELNGLPVGVSLCFADFPNAPAGKSYEAAPVLISFHDGDWHESQKLFKKRKDAK